MKVKPLDISLNHMVLPFLDIVIIKLVIVLVILVVKQFNLCFAMAMLNPAIDVVKNNFKLGPQTIPACKH